MKLKSSDTTKVDIIALLCGTTRGRVLLICRSGGEPTRSVHEPTISEHIADESHEVQDNTNEHNNKNVKRTQRVLCGCGKYVQHNRELMAGFVTT